MKKRMGEKDFPVGHTNINENEKILMFINSNRKMIISFMIVIFDEKSFNCFIFYSKNPNARHVMSYSYTCNV